MTRETEVRSWDETTGNVWHRLTACDHLLDIESWKHGDPPPGQDISFTTPTRHLRILKRRIEEILVTLVRHQDPHQIWKNISKEQWELLWSGEMTLHKYDSALWTVGHKIVIFYPDETSTSVPNIMCITGPGVQKHTVKIPTTTGLPQTSRKTIEQYLKLADWVSLLVNKEPQ